MNEHCAMVEGAVCVTLCIEIAVRTPALADDHSSRFDLSITAIQVAAVPSRTVQDTGLALNSAKQALPFHGVFRAVFTLTRSC